MPEESKRNQEHAIIRPAANLKARHHPELSPIVQVSAYLGFILIEYLVS